MDACAFIDFVPVARQMRDLRGQRYNRLAVLWPIRATASGTMWLCHCDCGAHTRVSVSSLSGRVGRKTSHSCGCLARELTAERVRSRLLTHGLARRGSVTKPIYKAWWSMLDRCYNPKHKFYKDWGGRGIRVCAEWRESVLTFYQDMGPKPTPQHTLERVNNNGDYEPSNCRWATMAEQSRNRRNNRILTHGGQTMCLTDLASQYGIHPTTLSQRIKRGWEIERALLTKPDCA